MAASPCPRPLPCLTQDCTSVNISWTLFTNYWWISPLESCYENRAYSCRGLSCKCTGSTNLYFLLSVHHTAIVHFIPPQTAFPSLCQGHGKVVFVLNRFVFTELVGYIFSWLYYSIFLYLASGYCLICLQKHFWNKIYPCSSINPCICSINLELKCHSLVKKMEGSGVNCGWI